MPSLLIRGGRIIDPALGRDQVGDLLISDGLIAAIETRVGPSGPLGSSLHAEQIIDAEGCIVCPGLVDIHVHLREPSDGRHEETIASGAAAAINGGFTTVCCMPNTRPPLDSPEAVRFVEQQARAADLARVFIVACATKGRHGAELAPIDELAAAGAVGFSDDGDVVADPEIMRQALAAAQRADRCFMQHCQDPTTTRGASMNAGPLAEKLGQIGWPAEAEESIIERDIGLNRDIGCRYHAQHLSSGGSAEIIRRARDAGQPVTGEASPHHLLLTEEDVVKGSGVRSQVSGSAKDASESDSPDTCHLIPDTSFKMNPPLRTSRDIELLKEAVADGTITVLATDHAPHPKATKDRPFAEASFGIVGLECALPLYVKALIDDGVIDWPRLIAMMTIEPARLVGLQSRGVGDLRVGLPADVTVIDPGLEWTIDTGQFASAGRNCPFEGWSVRGRAIVTVVDGRVKLLRDAARLVQPAASERGASGVF